MLRVSVFKVIALNAAILTVGFSLESFLLQSPSSMAETTTTTAAAPIPGKTVATVEPGTAGVAVVRVEAPTVFPDGFSQYRGVTSIDTGITQMSLNRVVLPPGAAGPRNMHKGSQSAVLVYQGTMTALIGEKGETVIEVKSGEFLFIPGDVWHQWTNKGSEPVAIAEARADADPTQNFFIIPTP